MIRHIVFWKVCEHGTEQDRREVAERFGNMLERLKEVIPEIEQANAGLNVCGGGFHVCVDSTFASMEALNRYIDHPEHQKVRQYMDSVSYDKTVFDYEG